MKLKKKYLHIELDHGNFYIFATNDVHRSKIVTLEQMNNECLIFDCIHNLSKFKIKIPLKDFIEE